MKPATGNRVDLDSLESHVTTESYGVSTAERMRRLKELDLTGVKNMLLCNVDAFGRCWRDRSVDLAEEWYRRYLAIHIQFPHIAYPIPTRPVDFFWREHLIDFPKYVSNCTFVLGHIIPRRTIPRGNENEKRLQAALETNRKLYQFLFNNDGSAHEQRFVEDFETGGPPPGGDIKPLL